MKPLYITTAIDYTNGEPHIGHAVEKVQADVLARYWKSCGREVYFSTGTDEHGQKIFEKAEKEGKEVKEMVDEYVKSFQKMDQVLGVEYDEFIRTTDQQRHWPNVEKMWQSLVASGDLHKDMYTGLYCVGCEEFKQDKDLVDGKCTLHEKEPEKVEEENYFFNIGKYTDQILSKIESGELEVFPEKRKNEVINILKEKQEFVSFSRPKEKLSWGIPVPDDPEHVMYVWCDALTNYLSSLDFANNGDLYKKYWQDGEVIHLIGKDIARFHTLIWPAMLISAGLELPERIYIHGFVSVNGKKLSKTTGNIVDPLELVNKYGVDATRYYLLKEIPSYGDGDFSEARFEEVYNSDLANGIGNLFSRVTNMVEQYLDGGVEELESNIDFSEANKLIESLQYDKALDLVIKNIGDVNKFIDDTKPWKLSKSEEESDKSKLKEVLDQSVADLKIITKVLAPFLPNVSGIMLESLNQNKITKAEGLFPRLDK